MPCPLRVEIGQKEQSTFKWSARPNRRCVRAADARELRRASAPLIKKRSAVARKQTLAPSNAGARMYFGAEVPAYFVFRFFSCFAAFFSFIVLAGFFFSDFFESIPLLISLPRSWSQSIESRRAP